MIDAIMKRWESNGGSSWSPVPTLDHHLTHILGASLAGVFFTAVMGWPWLYVGLGLTIISFSAEAAQNLGKSDSRFDVWQFQAHWFWYHPIHIAAIVFTVWVVGYFAFLLLTLDDKGNPK